MAQYIDKSAVAAELERQRKIYMYDVDNKHSFGRLTECNDLLVFLDTLEVKEIHQKQEWSLEDNNNILRLIAYFEDKERFSTEDDIFYADWLKSLKERYTWKPSEIHLARLEEE